MRTASLLRYAGWTLGLCVPCMWGAALGCSVFTASVWSLDAAPVVNGNLEGRKGLRSIVTSGKEVSLGVDPETGNRYLIVPGGEWAEFLTKLPSPPEAKAMDPEAWFGLVSFDVLNVDALQSSAWRIALVDMEGETEVLMDKGLFNHSDSNRISIVVPPEIVAAMVDQRYSVQIKIMGKTDGHLDNIAFERFHPAPTRKLLGKPNGKLGPDLIASGALGLYAITEHNSQALTVLKTLQGSPAEKAGLRNGDLIVAIEEQALPANTLKPGWDWFEGSHEALLGRAVMDAVDSGESAIALTVLRKGKYKEIRVKHRHTKLKPEALQLGPLDPLLRVDLTQWAIAHQKKNGSWKGADAVNPALGGLVLLASRDRKNIKAIERCKDFVLAKNPKPSEMKGLAYWTIAFHGIFLAEYYLASGDKEALAWVREAVEWLPTSTHESKWGTQAFGHGPDGLPYGEKALTAPASHLLVLDALARKCGIESRVWEHVQPYMEHAWSNPADGGHGGMGYNGSHRDKAEFWCRSGLTALAHALRGEQERMVKPLCLFMHERHPWMLNSHAYGEPGAALGLLGLAVADRGAFNAILPQWRWRFLNAWEPGYGLRWSTPHMGSPYMGEDSIQNLAYGVLSAVQDGSLVVAGGVAERWIR